MSSDPLFVAANLLLSEVLVTSFEMTKHEVKGEEVYFYFTENNSVPEVLTQMQINQNFA